MSTEILPDVFKRQCPNWIRGSGFLLFVTLHKTHQTFFYGFYFIHTYQFFYWHSLFEEDLEANVSTEKNKMAYFELV